MTTAQRFQAVIAYFEQAMPVAETELHYDSPFQLLVAVMLSAQCTDKRVNMVTPALFQAYPTPASMAAASVDEVLTFVKSVSYPNSKAKHLVEAARQLVERFGGEVPATREELVTLPGVGRKTANLICGDVYRKPAVVADTHLIRISNRLGLVDTKDPYKVEMALKKLLPPKESNDFCHRCVLHGRAVCRAQKPKCDQCCLKPYCKSAV